MKKTKRFLSTLIAVAMAFSMLPAIVFAEDTEETPTVVDTNDGVTVINSAILEVKGETFEPSLEIASAFLEVSLTGDDDESASLGLSTDYTILRENSSLSYQAIEVNENGNAVKADGSPVYDPADFHTLNEVSQYAGDEPLKMGGSYIVSPPESEFFADGNYYALEPNTQLVNPLEPDNMFGAGAPITVELKNADPTMVYFGYRKTTSPTVKYTVEYFLDNNSIEKVEFNLSVPLTNPNVLSVARSTKLPAGEYTEIYKVDDTALELPIPVSTEVGKTTTINVYYTAVVPTPTPTPTPPTPPTPDYIPPYYNPDPTPAAVDVIIEDEEIPLAKAPELPAEIIEIVDNEIPLGKLPKSGGLQAASLSGIGLLAFAVATGLKFKKKED